MTPDLNYYTYHLPGVSIDIMTLHIMLTLAVNVDSLVAFFIFNKTYSAF